MKTAKKNSYLLVWLLPLLLLVALFIVKNEKVYSTYGKQDVTVYDASEKEIAELVSSEKIKCIDGMRLYGNTTIGEETLSVGSITNNGLISIHMVNGRYPNHEGEMAISESAFYKCDRMIGVNDSIEISYNQFDSIDYKIVGVFKDILKDDLVYDFDYDEKKHQTPDLIITSCDLFSPQEVYLIKFHDGTSKEEMEEILSSQQINSYTFNNTLNEKGGLFDDCFLIVYIYLSCFLVIIHMTRTYNSAMYRIKKRQPVYMLYMIVGFAICFVFPVMQKAVIPLFPISNHDYMVEKRIDLYEDKTHYHINYQDGLSAAQLTKLNSVSPAISILASKTIRMNISSSHALETLSGGVFMKDTGDKQTFYSDVCFLPHDLIEKIAQCNSSMSIPEEGIINCFILTKNARLNGEKVYLHFEQVFKDKPMGAVQNHLTFDAALADYYLCPDQMKDLFLNESCIIVDEVVLKNNNLYIPYSRVLIDCNKEDASLVKGYLQSYIKYRGNSSIMLVSRSEQLQSLFSESVKLLLILICFILVALKEIWLYLRI